MMHEVLVAGKKDRKRGRGIKLSTGCKDTNRKEETHAGGQVSMNNGLRSDTRKLEFYNSKY
jgi:hypothetical protein